MNIDYDLINLYAQDSLARRNFKENVNLKEILVPQVKIPSRFKEKSFVPQGGLDIANFSFELKKELKSFGLNDLSIKKTVPGVCEAIKNAYEHGNSHDDLKEVFFATCFGQDLEFLIGDQGGIIDGNFIPFVLAFRQGKHDPYYCKVPNFYEFSGKLYTPLGHSGSGTKTMNICFPKVNYFMLNSGLLVYLSKPSR